jgi:hypothetical protein
MTLAFSTIRQLRSTASQFHVWDMMISQPDRPFMDQQHCVLEQPCCPTDGLSYTLYGGLHPCAGNQTQPSVVLLDCHVWAFDQELNQPTFVAVLPKKNGPVHLVSGSKG